MSEDERQAKCKYCGEPIFLTKRKYNTVVVRKATDEEMEKRTWRHTDGFKHCTLARASPDDEPSLTKEVRKIISEQRKNDYFIPRPRKDSSYLSKKKKTE